MVAPLSLLAGPINLAAGFLTGGAASAARTLTGKTGVTYGAANEYLLGAKFEIHRGSTHEVTGDYAGAEKITDQAVLLVDHRHHGVDTRHMPDERLDRCVG